jgi:hypothetical protein
VAEEEAVWRGGCHGHSFRRERMRNEKSDESEGQVYSKTPVWRLNIMES